MPLFFSTKETIHFENEKRIIRKFVLHKKLQNVTALFMHVNILQIRQHSFVGFMDGSYERWKDVEFVFDYDLKETTVKIAEENKNLANRFFK